MDDVDERGRGEGPPLKLKAYVGHLRIGRRTDAAAGLFQFLRVLGRFLGTLQRGIPIHAEACLYHRR